MARDSMGAIKASVLRSDYRAKIERYRLQIEPADNAASTAMQRARVAQASGDPLPMLAAIDAAIDEMSAKAGILVRQLGDSDLHDEDRLRLAADLDRTRDEIDRLGAERAIAPLTRFAQIDQAEAAGFGQAYTEDLRAYGAGSQTSHDISDERRALELELAAESALESGGGIDQARFLSSEDQITQKLAGLEVRSGAYAPSPDLEARYLEERGAFGRLERFGDPRDEAPARAELMQTTDDLIAGLRSQYYAAIGAAGVSRAGRAELRLGYERAAEPLLDEQARIASEQNRSFLDSLPDLSVGAESFAMRYLPSPAQSASERDQFASAAPGFGALPTLPVAAAPMPVKLVGGEISITVVIPGVGKTLARLPVASVQKSSETGGMGSHYPGM